MLEWCVGIATTLLTILIYFAYFFKFNWVKDLRTETKTRQNRSFYASNKHRKVGKLPPVYPNGWFALLENSQIKNGQVKHVCALGENFAVFRTERGVVNILDAYCPHLGANMAEGGRVKGDCLECPFHSWTFRGKDGYCENIPYAEKVPHVARVKVWKSCEVNNIIFVWYHSESAEPDWQPQSHTCISNGSWRYQGRNEYLINCHIQEIAENGADPAHLTSVHAKSNKEKHKAGLHMCHKLVLLERFSVMEIDVLAEQIGPSYVELIITTSIGPMYILQTVTPVEPLLQRVTHQIYSPPLLAPYANLIFLGECVMFERDIKIWNYKRYERQPILVREDRAIQAYRRWYSQFYSEHSPTYETAMKDLQW
ncbi:3-chlorobenzoate-3,4-dioxygenase oxygenase subunit [Cyphomyrmex costatus]|uniref:cholesterol 7-desaturase n=1 Tax=Cyphomyrmex costatus TaxID=456900 RepID=A0A151I7I5_9HYME|nr:3-chlorobenzoate-3,4-dioxygenase oxygenase subunit [Cyphomyrmex costatus]